MRFTVNLLVLLGLFIFTSVFAEESWDYRGNVEIEVKAFSNEAKYPLQSSTRSTQSVAINPEFSRNIGEAGRVLFEGFARYDTNDENRTHLDARELNYLHVGDEYELTVGLARVFWGVTESRHLVDIINQTDNVENLRGEDKLGQSMIHFDWIKDWGTTSLFALPGFRTRVFNHEEARLSGPVIIDEDNALFESDQEEMHVDFAARWTNSYDAWDVGIGAFVGTNREPRLVPSINNGNLLLVPFYDQIKQASLDLQMTGENILLKLESIYRSSNNEDFVAAVGGFEYTFFGIAESNLDIGVIMEVLYDGRDNALSPSTNADDDTAIGLRLALNDTADTQLLAVLVMDNKDQTTLLNVEAERRVADSWKISLEGALFTNVDNADPLSVIANEDHVTFSAAYYY